MSQFQINYLGCGSASPTLRHLPSCQVVDFRGNLFMVDCGECAQLSMRRQKLKYSRLGHIFISHLHGDHCLGLPGLVSTLALTGGRDGGSLTIHTFREGAEMFRRMFDFFCHMPPFEIIFDIIDPQASSTIFENDAITVRSFPLYHRLPCVGFAFEEKPKLRHLKGDMVKFFNVPISQYQAIKSGADFVTPDGQVIANDRLTTPADRSMSYAYCSDTLFNPKVAKSIEGIHTIYHEATYCDDQTEKARLRFHSTASQAARIAEMAGAEQLVLGHFSKSYHNEQRHLEEARAIFPNTVIANEGLVLPL